MEEKRRHPRFVVEGVQGVMHYSCPLSILNMSLGGAAVEVPMRLNIGREYALNLELQDRSAQLAAVVVWSVLSEMRQGPTGETVPYYSAGLKFKDVLSAPMSDLISFIGENKLYRENRLQGMRFRIGAPGKVAVDVPQVYDVRLISLAGMLIRTEQSLEIEGTYPMEICPPDQPPIRFSGRVASQIEVAQDGPAYYEVGIEFTDITTENRARLDQFIATLTV